MLRYRNEIGKSTPPRLQGRFHVLRAVTRMRWGGVGVRWGRADARRRTGRRARIGRTAGLDLGRAARRATRGARGARGVGGAVGMAAYGSGAGWSWGVGM